MTSDTTNASATVSKENHFLRTLCIVFIIFVVIVHYWPVLEFGRYDLTQIIQAVGRFAMPVFFMISGYFTYSADGHAENKIGKRAIRLFLLIVFLKFFYLGVDLILCAFGHVDISQIPRNFIVVGDSTAHYWFIAMLLTCYLGYWIFHHFKIDFKYFVPLSIFVILFDLYVCEFLPLIGQNELFGQEIGELSSGTYFCLAPFFFQAGYYLHKYKPWTDEHWSNKMLILAMIFGMALHLVECYFTLETGFYDFTSQRSPNVTVGTIIFSFALFVATFRLGENQLRFKRMEWMGRNIMPWMYVFASLGSYVLKPTILVHFEDNFFIHEVVGTILAIVVDIVAALVMYYLLKAIFEKKKNSKKAVSQA